MGFEAARQNSDWKDFDRCRLQNVDGCFDFVGGCSESLEEDQWKLPALEGQKLLKH